MGTDLFVWHGYSTFFVGGRWTKASSAFNRGAVRAVRRGAARLRRQARRAAAPVHAATARSTWSTSTSAGPTRPAAQHDALGLRETYGAGRAEPETRADLACPRATPSGAPPPRRAPRDPPRRHPPAAGATTSPAVVLAPAAHDSPIPPRRRPGVSACCRTPDSLCVPRYQSRSFQPIAVGSSDGSSAAHGSTGSIAVRVVRQQVARRSRRGPPRPPRRRAARCAHGPDGRARATTSGPPRSRARTRAARPRPATRCPRPPCSCRSPRPARTRRGPARPRRRPLPVVRSRARSARPPRASLAPAGQQGSRPPHDFPSP